MTAPTHPSGSVVDRVDRERRSHEDDDVLARSYELKARFPHVRSYPSRIRMDSRVDEILMSLRGADVLDLGCGRGELSHSVISLGAKSVVGIDIAFPYTADALTQGSGVSAIHGDAHRLPFAAGSFDAVLGLGILHHLDVDAALAEIVRVLRPGGLAVFQEPLAGNVLLKLFRRLTPSARTEDERPLDRRDLAIVNSLARTDATLSYCGILEAPVAMATSILAPRNPGNVVLRVADRVERTLHRRGRLSAWNQYVLVELRRQTESG